MATKKNQHYVPQFYLRNFSKDGKTIGCCYVNGDNSKHIEAAPIKSQAAEDYFYSRDTRLETEFSKLEGKANDIIRKILSTDFRMLSCLDKSFIKQFIIFQSIRTPNIAKAYENVMSDFFNMVNGTNDGIKRVELKGKQIFVLNSLFPYIPKIAKKLQICVLENNTDIPYITAVEPVAFFNPYQKKRGTMTGGREQHGSMYFYPLSAKKAIILYDRKAYRECGDKLHCSISDVANLNAQIFITLQGAGENTFYYDNSDTNAISSLSKMKDYIGDYPVLSFLKEKRLYLKMFWI